MNLIIFVMDRVSNDPPWNAFSFSISLLDFSVDGFKVERLAIFRLLTNLRYFSWPFSLHFSQNLKKCEFPSIKHVWSIVWPCRCHRSIVRVRGFIPSWKNSDDTIILKISIRPANENYIERCLFDDTWWVPEMLHLLFVHPETRNQFCMPPYFGFVWTHQ